MKQNDFDRIERYIAGKADDSERKYMESKFLNEENNHYFRHALEKDWDQILSDEQQSEVQLNHILDRIHHAIHRREFHNRQKLVKRFMRIYMKVAAILLLPLLLTVGFFYSSIGYHGRLKADQQVFSTIYAPLGSRVSFVLPDSTTGMLNSGSKLSYQLPFNNNRKILLEGEAWFEVKSDKKHPFKISTINSLVSVLGTRFNLSAYPAENYIEVVLQEGKIEFNNIKNKEKMTMLPSERLVFENGKVTKSVVDPTKYNSWTEGKLVFRGDPMAEVVRRIERWYNVKINIADRELQKYSFRGTFQDDKLEDVLKFLCLTSPIRFTISPRELMTDGSYKKEEVTIYKKN